MSFKSFISNIFSEKKEQEKKKMKYLEIFKEIDVKIHEMCHEALKEGGAYLLPHVNQLASALQQILNYQPPNSPAPSEVEGNVKVD
jgi:hypothetical protein